MNIGVVAVLWSLSPLFIAISEYFVYGYKLYSNYIIGMVFMIASAIILSVNNFMMVSEPEQSKQN